MHSVPLRTGGPLAANESGDRSSCPVLFLAPPRFPSLFASPLSPSNPCARPPSKPCAQSTSVSATVPLRQLMQFVGQAFRVLLDPTDHARSTQPEQLQQKSPATKTAPPSSPPPSPFRFLSPLSLPPCPRSPLAHHIAVASIKNRAAQPETSAQRQSIPTRGGPSESQTTAPPQKGQPSDSRQLTHPTSPPLTVP